MVTTCILVVCIGNICRSPMAQALFSRSLEDVTVLSAGTDAAVGEPADENARDLMASRGIDISSHRAQQVNLSLCRQASIILVMDQMQRRSMQARYPLATGKIFRLGEFDQVNIPDPYRQSREMFEHVLTLIEKGVESWSKNIRRI